MSFDFGDLKMFVVYGLFVCFWQFGELWFLSLCVADFLRNLVIFVLDFVLWCYFGVCLFWRLRFLALM